MMWAQDAEKRAAEEQKRIQTEAKRLKKMEVGSLLI